MAAQSLDFAADVAFSALDLAYQLFEGLGATDYMIAFFIITAVCSLLIMPMRGRGLGSIADFSINQISKSNQKVVNRERGRQVRAARSGRSYRAGKGTYEH